MKIRQLKTEHVNKGRGAGARPALQFVIYTYYI